MAPRMGSLVSMLVLVGSSVASGGCGEPEGRPPADSVGIGSTSLDGGAEAGEGPGQPGDGPGDPSDGGDADDSGDPHGDGGPDEGAGEIRLDVAVPDLPGPSKPVIPETCAEAEVGESTVGCRFFGVDLDSHDGFEQGQFAIAVSNVQEARIARVRVERKQAGVWSAVAPAEAVAPLSLHIFELPAFHQDDSGILVGGAYRVRSDVPIIAYQFNPIDGASSYLSDASMLYPVPAWDSINHVVGWRVTDDGQLQGAYVTIVAATDGTEVEITPSVTTLAGFGIPASLVGVPFTIRLDEGDVAEVMTKTRGQGLSGTRIVSDVDHPVAVFSGTECSFIPIDVQACDHLEEQLSGVRLWGRRFIASRVPPRSAHDPSLWQIYASEDGTTVRLRADPQLTGIAEDTLELDAGEFVELFVGGTLEVPGDFEIVADKPIAVVDYMTGSENPGAGIGDPAMVQISPIEQFLPRYVVLVPGTWINDVAVITRPAGAAIRLDGELIDDGLFIPVVDSGFEVARVPVADGVHTLDGTLDGKQAAFSVIIVGFDTFDSYAYLGGTGTGRINPNPIR